MATVEMEPTFIKQKHICASKAIAGLAFTTVFLNVYCEEMYALVHTRSKREK